MLRAVIIDSREPQWCKSLRLGSAPTTVQTLPSGDAWLATDDTTVVVERKTVNDLCASIADGRLLNQVVEMRSASPWCYVVVSEMPSVRGGEMIIHGKASRWQWRSVQGALMTVQELGVGIVWCESEADYGASLEWIASRNREGIVVGARRDAVMQPPAEAILTALPGIAAGRAEALLKYCGSVAWALDYLTDLESEEHIPGIGPATMAAVRAALGLDDSQILSVLSREE